MADPCPDCGYSHCMCGEVDDGARDTLTDPIDFDDDSDDPTDAEGRQWE